MSGSCLNKTFIIDNNDIIRTLINIFIYSYYEKVFNSKTN